MRPMTYKEIKKTLLALEDDEQFTIESLRKKLAAIEKAIQESQKKATEKKDSTSLMAEKVNGARKKVADQESALANSKLKLAELLEKQFEQQLIASMLERAQSASQREKEEMGNRLMDINRQIAELQAKKKTLLQEKSPMIDESQFYQKECDDIKSQINLLEREQQESESKFESLKASLDETHTKLQTVKEKLTESRQVKEEHEKRLTTWETRYKNVLNNENNLTEEQYQSGLNLYDRYQRSETMTIQNSKGDIERLQAESERLEREQKETQEQIDDETKAIADRKSKIQVQQQHQAYLQSMIDSLPAGPWEAQLRRVEEQLQMLNQQAREVENAYETRIRDLSERQATNQRESNRTDRNIDRQKDQIKNETRTLEESVSTLAQFQKGYEQASKKYNQLQSAVVDLARKFEALDSPHGAAEFRADSPGVPGYENSLPVTLRQYQLLAANRMVKNLYKAVAKISSELSAMVQVYASTSNPISTVEEMKRRADAVESHFSVRQSVAYSQSEKSIAANMVMGMTKMQDQVKQIPALVEKALDDYIKAQKMLLYALLKEQQFRRAEADYASQNPFAVFPLQLDEEVYKSEEIMRVALDICKLTGKPFSLLLQEIVKESDDHTLENVKLDTLTISDKALQATRESSLTLLDVNLEQPLPESQIEVLHIDVAGSLFACEDERQAKQYFKRWLASHPLLRRIELDGGESRLDWVHLPALFAAMEELKAENQLSSMTELVCRDFLFSQEMATPVRVLQQCQVLNLTNCQLPGAFLEAVVTESPQLQTLVLAGATIDGEGASESLSAAMKLPSLKVLNLSGFASLKDNAAMWEESISDGLDNRKQTALVDVDLSGNRFREEGLRLIFKNLQEARRLDVLNISRVPLNEKNARHLTTLIEDNQGIQHLVMEQVRIADADLLALIHEMKDRKSPLKMLNLSGVELRDQHLLGERKTRKNGLVALLGNKNLGLESLHLAFYRDVQSKLLKKIFTLLHENQPLLELKMENVTDDMLTKKAQTELKKLVEKGALRQLQVEGLSSKAVSPDTISQLANNAENDAKKQQALQCEMFKAIIRDHESLGHAELPVHVPRSLLFESALESLAWLYADLEAANQPPLNESAAAARLPVENPVANYRRHSNSMRVSMDDCAALSEAIAENDRQPGVPDPVEPDRNTVELQQELAQSLAKVLKKPNQSDEANAVADAQPAASAGQSLFAAVGSRIPAPASHSRRSSASSLMFEPSESDHSDDLRTQSSGDSTSSPRSAMS